MMKKILLLGGVLLFFTPAKCLEARQVINIVGSSTVYPFAKVVTEKFAKNTGLALPKLKSTGSGGGFKLFCAGAKQKSPDISNASRSINRAEYNQCVNNGVKKIVEVKIGYDGIVIANSSQAPRFKLTIRDIFLALARDVPDGGQKKLIPNPYVFWNEVDPALPPFKIQVYGPPPTSGTRDAFERLAMEKGCRTFTWLKKLKKRHKEKFLDICKSIRQDGVYINSGENDNLIVDKLEANKNAFGIFGYSYLEQNQNDIQGAYINSSLPDFQTISSASYPLSRPLYFYVNKGRAESIPGLKRYLMEFTEDSAWGPKGYLITKGLIPMSNKERVKYREIAKKLIIIKRW